MGILRVFFSTKQIQEKDDEEAIGSLFLTERTIDLPPEPTVAAANVPLPDATSESKPMLEPTPTQAPTTTPFTTPTATAEPVVDSNIGVGGDTAVDISQSGISVPGTYFRSVGWRASHHRYLRNWHWGNANSRAILDENRKVTVQGKFFLCC